MNDDEEIGTVNLLDNPEAVTKSFNKEVKQSFSYQQQWELNKKEAEDHKILQSYTKKLKVISLFFVVFAIFLLLNSAIGFSSAPFYDSQTECNRYETNQDCETLRAYTEALYSFEIVGALFLVVQGLLGMTVIEHMKNVRLIKFLSCYTKIVIVIYIFVCIIRFFLYMKIIKELEDPDVGAQQTSTNYGGFLASYVENITGANVLTTILIATFFTCFGFNIWEICIVQSLLTFHGGDSFDQSQNINSSGDLSSIKVDTNTKQQQKSDPLTALSENDHQISNNESGAYDNKPYMKINMNRITEVTEPQTIYSESQFHNNSSDLNDTHHQNFGFNKSIKQPTSSCKQIPVNDITTSSSMYENKSQSEYTTTKKQ